MSRNGGWKRLPGTVPMPYNRIAMHKITWFCLFVLFLPGCVSFRGHLPDEPEIVVDYLAVVRNIDHDNQYVNRVASEAIRADDPAVYALVKVVNVAAPLRLQWSWYNPEKKLVKRSKTVEVNSRKKFLEYFVAWDVLPRSLFAGSKGKWVVAVAADRKFLGRAEFDIP